MKLLILSLIITIFESQTFATPPEDIKISLQRGDLDSMTYVDSLDNNCVQLREVFRDELTKIAEESSIDQGIIGIQKILITPEMDPLQRKRFKTPHVDPFFQSQNRDFPYKWVLVYSNERPSDSTSTIIYLNSSGEHITGDPLTSHELPDSHQKKHHLPTELHRFGVNWVHSSPTESSDTRLVLHFYIQCESEEKIML